MDRERMSKRIYVGKNSPILEHDEELQKDRKGFGKSGRNLEEEGRNFGRKGMRKGKALELGRMIFGKEKKLFGKKMSQEITWEAF